MNCAALDVGASGGKLFCGRFDGDKLSLETIHRFPHGPVSLQGNLYWDFLFLYQQMLQGLQKAAAQAGKELLSFGVDTFSNDFSFVDPAGRLLSPVFCYRDRRTQLHQGEIFSRISPRELYFSSGNQVALFNTAMQLGAMAAEGSPLLSPGSHRLLLLPDLLCYYLTGEMAGEYTVCSVSQLLDFSTRDWHGEILDRLAIPRELLPDIVEPGTPRGKISKMIRSETALPGLDVISVCEHDTASAFLASVAEEPAILISSGTWALVGLETDKPVINELGYRYNVANEGGCLGHHRVLKNVMGNWLFQQLKAECHSRGEEYDYPDLERLAAHAPACRMLVDVDHPDFFTPGDIIGKLRQRAVYSGQEPPDDVRTYARCIYDSLALKYRWCVEKLEEVTGLHRNVINVMGGGARDSLSCQLTANACARRVIAGPYEATALGNVVLQLISWGELRNIAQGRSVLRASFGAKEYTPEGSDFWDEQYQYFCETFSL